MNREEKRKFVEESLRQGKIVTPADLLRLDSPKKGGNLILTQPHSRPRVDVTVSYLPTSRKSTVQDFVAYFNARYKTISAMLMGRRELTHLTSISRLTGMMSNTRVSLIAMITNKRVTKNGNIVIDVEDQSGATRVIITKTNTHFQIAKELVFDEVIGITGTTKDKVIFANDLLLPDVPATGELLSGPRDINAAFLSDIHVGSNLFMGNEFDKFLKWINAQTSNSAQKEEAKKTEYVFIAGDVVDGVGVYQGQQDELSIKDVREQYSYFAELLGEIPQDKQIVIAPGNHDAVSSYEPQPTFTNDFTLPLSKLPNVTLLSNPGIVTIEQTSEFQGLKVMLYHGYSFDYYIANVDSIRQNGGYDRPDLVMKFLLQRRHLAPTHTSTLYVPDPNQDPLVITTVPDILHTGHVHRTGVGHYRGVQLVNSSCWQGLTPFQKRLGHNPEPARVVLVNTHTRKAKILRFGT